MLSYMQAIYIYDIPSYLFLSNLFTAVYVSRIIERRVSQPVSHADHTLFRNKNVKFSSRLEVLTELKKEKIQKISNLHDKS